MSTARYRRCGHKSGTVLRAVVSVLLVLTLTGACAVSACDLHGVSTTTPAGVMPDGWHLGIAEQYTRFRTLQVDGDDIGNPQGESLDSAITQFNVGYWFHDRFGVQLSMPVIYRPYDRVDDHDLEHGTESGIGDVLLMARGLVVNYHEQQRAVEWGLFAGVKFPTGNSDRLREEHGEDHHEHASGIHGHDLALGSGSYDVVIGSTLFGRSDRWFVTAGIQYAIRTEGDHGYQFAHDLIWSGGPGLVLWEHETSHVGIQLFASGEHKGEDKVDGQHSDDTAITSVFLGPQLAATWRERLTGLVGVDLPVDIDNSGLQLVPDLRVRATAIWTF